MPHLWGLIRCEALKGKAESSLMFPLLCAFRDLYSVSKTTGLGIRSLVDSVQIMVLELTQENCSGREDDFRGEYTRDGSLDYLGRPALKGRSGGWKAGLFLLVNQGLSILAFMGIEVNLVLFCTRVLRQTNAEAANTFSKWMGTVHLCSLVGAFLSDSYWGRYKTCVVFQILFAIGLVTLSLSTYSFLLKPHGCGKKGFLCNSHSSLEVAVFYFSIYLVALGQGASESPLATFGSDQFSEDDANEKSSKESFYSYFYVAIKMGLLFSETILVYIEDTGNWVLAFLVSAGCGSVALIVLLSGSLRYRHFKPSGNPLSRFCQVIVVAVKKSKVKVPSDANELFEVDRRASAANGGRKILHSNDYKFLDRAAVITSTDKIFLQSSQNHLNNPWQLCSISQVEEVKSILRLIPIWLCTTLYSVLFVQMTSLFLEQGATMDTSTAKIHIPPASMTIFDTVGTLAFIIFYDKLILPCYAMWMKKTPKVPTDLKRMGIGLVIIILANVAAGVVEHYRLKYAMKGGNQLSSLSIFWQVPQHVLMGLSDAFMYVGKLEFFTAQTPDGLKSLGAGLSMASDATGSYFSSLLLTAVMEVTAKSRSPGWIPPNLNEGHMDKFFFLLAALGTINLAAYIVCAVRYKGVAFA